MRDMREILELARDDAPPPRSTVDDLVVAGRRRRRRRAFVERAAGAGVAATLAVLIIGTLVSLQPRGGGFANLPADTAAAEPEVATASPPFTFTFTGFTVDSYRVLAPDQVSPAYQVASILRDTKDAQVQYMGSLTVFQPGVFNPERFRTGTRVTVQGREAFQAQLEHKLSTPWRIERSFTTDTVTTDALAWQYLPNAWAVIDSERFTVEGQQPFSHADQTKLAERFRLTAGDPAVAKVPFRTGYLPAGFTLLSVDGQSLTSENRGMATFVYAKPDNSLDSVTGPREFLNTSPGPAAVISILWVDNPPPDAAARTSRCNEGQHWCMRNLPGNEFYVAISDPSKSLTDEELLKIADSLDFASIKDPTTWYPVS